jgi:glutamine synthetase
MQSKFKTTVNDVIREIKDKEIRFLDLKFVDLFGNLQHLTIPTNRVDEDTFKNGFNFDGSSVKGFQRIHASDMILRPDPESLFNDPFYEDPTLSVFCDIIDPDGYKPYSRDPRGIARRAENLFRSLGVADNVYLGPEIEFFIFDDVRFDQATQHGYYFINSTAAFWNRGEEGVPNLGHQAARKQAYFSAPPIDAYHNIRSKISDVLQLTGITPELHHHEVAAAGQSEIAFRFGPLMSQADSAVKYKYVVKNAVDRYGKTVTFMPKPLLQENGSGMHVNISLSQGGKNIFYEPGGYADLSQTALQFIAGILKHAPALCAICSPTTNSYRRLVPGYEAPMNLVFSQRNRSACIRVPMAAGSSAAKRIEFRTPDPSANPYLAFAAIALAGLDGIRTQMQPPEPVDEDIYELAKSSDILTIKSIPGSLAEAMDALECDHDFLIKDGVFPPEVIKGWIKYKREEEIEFINLRPHPAEFTLYFNV